LKWTLSCIFGLGNTRVIIVVTFPFHGFLWHYTHTVHTNASNSHRSQHVLPHHVSKSNNNWECYLFLNTTHNNNIIRLRIHDSWHQNISIWNLMYIHFSFSLMYKICEDEWYYEK
jgi:hypothetical protein